MPEKLPDQLFLQMVANMPLASIDLIIYNEKKQIGLGLRKNEPAKGTWYFPGGRIFKNESIEDAVGRIIWQELGIKRHHIPLKIVGVNNWFFNSNFLGEKDVTTHYVALAMELHVETKEINRRVVKHQHTNFRWFTEEQAYAEEDVHADVVHVLRRLQDRRDNVDEKK